jgi:hypothetical protein
MNRKRLQLFYTGWDNRTEKLLPSQNFTTFQYNSSEPITWSASNDPIASLAELKSKKLVEPAVAAALVKELMEQVASNNYDDAPLRSAIAVLDHHYIVKHLKDSVVPIQRCDGCHLTSFSCNLTRAYGGLQYVCKQCRKFYVDCSACRSLILKDDTSLHFHVGALVDLIPLDKLKGWKDKIDPTPVFGPHDRPNSRLFGIELEVERSTDRPVPPDLVVKALRSFQNGFVMAKRDGSLSAAPGQSKKGTNGFEIVSLPATLRYHLQYAGWQQLLAMLEPFTMNKPVTAGLHVHVNSASTTPLTIGKVGQFINHASNLKFMMSVADRDFTQPSPNHPKGGSYCPVDNATSTSAESIRQKVAQVSAMRLHDPKCPRHPHFRGTRGYYYNHKVKNFSYDPVGAAIISSIDGALHFLPPCSCDPGMYVFPDHYAGFNLLTKQPTFEFRMFQASNNPTHFAACVEFCDAIVNYCDQAALTELHHTHFLSWYQRGMRRIYPALTSWLIETGYLQRRERRE